MFDQEAPETVWLGSETSEEIIRRNPTVGSSEQRRLSTLPAGHPQGYAQCFEAFIDDTYATILGEHREALPTFADGVRSARIVDAVVQSAQAGQQVTVETRTDVRAAPDSLQTPSTHLSGGSLHVPTHP